MFIVIGNLLFLYLLLLPPIDYCYLFCLAFSLAAAAWHQCSLPYNLKSPIPIIICIWYYLRIILYALYICIFVCRPSSSLFPCTPTSIQLGSNYLLPIRHLGNSIIMYVVGRVCNSQGTTRKTITDGTFRCTKFLLGYYFLCRA